MAKSKLGWFNFYIGSTEPKQGKNKVNGTLWVDTSGATPLIKVWDDVTRGWKTVVYESEGGGGGS